MVTRGGHVARRCFLSIVHRSKEVGRLRVLLQRAGRGGPRRRLRERWIWAANLDWGSKMNSDAPVTDAAFQTFIHCETKAYLLHESIDSQSKFGIWEEGLSQQFKQLVSEWLSSGVGDDEVYVGTASQRMLE
jgi:hypothetical protein